MARIIDLINYQGCVSTLLISFIWVIIVKIRINHPICSIPIDVPWISVVLICIARLGIVADMRPSQVIQGDRREHPDLVRAAIDRFHLPEQPGSDIGDLQIVVGRIIVADKGTIICTESDRGVLADIADPITPCRCTSLSSPGSRWHRPGSCWWHRRS